ncbi:solute carrier family 13 member 2-like isoform X1 [Lingula anatina]|uniref:Solute carrier family 13 member 2-like isoform X1 n=1 Tax=Lingula anatina TaxID=7574 RepID=A0A1S3I7E7_LINAN|nr:solute carrier family 13 member 2-like isoform X1 [Lingula anatina]|eukprot:XP_013393776.1 solute carrier family 13 member 2-like isoform X1 [Lingula anatina]
MGPISFAEILVSIHFGVLALLWITRDPGFAPGWGNLFPDKYVTDATPAMLIAISLFMWPSQRPRFLCCKDRNDSSEISPVPSLLDWATLNRKMPWSVVLLLGGGFALADAAKVMLGRGFALADAAKVMSGGGFALADAAKVMLGWGFALADAAKESGLSSLVGNALSTFAGIPASALVVILGAIVAFLTEVTSNTATATLIIPILGELSIQIGVHPLYLIFPATLACSFAFMLPVATPPNAIVFSYGTLRVRDMVVAGIGMNIMCLAVVALATNTWGLAFFKLGEPPQWVKDQHTTVPTSPAFTGIASTIYSFQNCTGLT